MKTDVGLSHPSLLLEVLRKMAQAQPGSSALKLCFFSCIGELAGQPRSVSLLLFYQALYSTSDLHRAK